MKGAIIIILVWILLNTISYLTLGTTALCITNWSCMALIWIFRKKLTKLLNI